MPRPTRKQLIDLLTQAVKHGFDHTPNCDYRKWGGNDCDCGVEFNRIGNQKSLSDRIKAVLAEEKRHVNAD